MRMLNWESGDVGPFVTTTAAKTSSFFKSMIELKKQEGGK